MLQITWSGRAEKGAPCLDSMCCKVRTKIGVYARTKMVGKEFACYNVLYYILIKIIHTVSPVCFHPSRTVLDFYPEAIT